MKRLFVFAAYNKDDSISNTLLDYVAFLSELGDVIVVFDNDVTKKEIIKLQSVKNIIHIESKRHGEYDFGSYKRGYLWAKKHKILNKYDWLYFVNDSVYCLASPNLILKELESKKVDLTGIVAYADCQTPVYVQSWFVGVSKKIANAEFFETFMSNIQKQEVKSDIVLKYEVGLSRCVLRHGFPVHTFIEEVHNKTIVYKSPFVLLNQDAPFIKKKSLPHVVNIHQLYSYAENENIVKHIAEDVSRFGIVMAKNNYVRVYKLSVFGVPVWQKYQSQDGTTIKYKLFGLPVSKIVK